MDIVKTAVDWTRAEMLSSSFFIAFGLLFLGASFGFSYLGKTELARAYVIPTMVAGSLLLIIGGGIFIQSYGRVTSFPAAYGANPADFLSSELLRAEAVLGQYRIAVFRVIPLIIVACAVLFALIDSPIWRASLATTIAMMSVILIIDTNANTRLAVYKTKLEQAAPPE
ncbi:hypothetical protein BXY66_0147 [Shimia isoporae]|uniref:Uncharacterized protein n=1 Tax=Shimia isoporae TaxID=647720 RepID=A0A4R1NJ10_9RHOB|nr:hypothetical protein [Shimia isoporae]TCL08114.1 hypothetical protein BXY66_0147 [Shimia isoporae]